MLLRSSRADSHAGTQIGQSLSVPLLSQPWSVPGQELLCALGVDPHQGLSAAEVRVALARWGPKRLPAAVSPPWWKPPLPQFTEVLVLLLGVLGGWLRPLLPIHLLWINWQRTDCPPLAVVYLEDLRPWYRTVLLAAGEWPFVLPWS